MMMASEGTGDGPPVGPYGLADADLRVRSVTDTSMMFIR